MTLVTLIMAKFYIQSVKRVGALCWLAVSFLLATHPAWATQNNSDSSIRTRVVPLVFSNDNTGIAYGLGGVSLGVGQPQAALFALGFTSKNDSKAITVGAVNYKLPHVKRWYFSGFFYGSDMPQYGYFINDMPGYAVRGNDSPFESQRTGVNTLTKRLQARWVLPIGAAKDPGFSLTRRPILPEQPQLSPTTHPEQSGISSLRFEWEQQSRDFIESSKTSATGADVFRTKLDWDNTGSRLIPASGSRARISTSWGKNHENHKRWRLYEASVSGFFKLPVKSAWAKQQVVALNLSLADTPTWNDDAGQARPPDYLGARLGGLSRLRGYRASRFFDRSAWVYRAEYRLIPQWQPLTRFADKLGYRIPWWQFALFADMGRVAPSFNLARFHEDMKTTAGAGVRILAEGLLIRVDFAHSDEEFLSAVIIDQAF